jgi:hypothetical protein
MDASTARQPTGCFPKGIFFETARQRWRVRLYKQGDVVHLSYHRSIEDALENWLVAKTIQQHAVRRTFVPSTNTMYGLLHTLSNDLHPHFSFSRGSIF